jgi:dolichyl-phosphate beta-glucosyltransferase
MQKVCVIIPCYNEEKRLAANDFIDFISASSTFFCFVNDGSSDNTIAVLNNIYHENKDKVLVVDLPNNKGKAEAIRMAVEEVINWQPFDAIGYLDADLATPLVEFQKLEAVIESSPDILFVMGSRVTLLGRDIHRTAKRHYLGRIFSTFSSIILQLPVYDTQCGAKLIKIDIAKEIFAEKFLTSWLFDIELIARTKKLDAYTSRSFVEVPLHTWSEKEGSKLRLKHIIKVPVDLLRICIKYRSNSVK